jgi:hypothetical protein
LSLLLLEAEDELEEDLEVFWSCCCVDPRGITPVALFRFLAGTTTTSFDQRICIVKNDASWWKNAQLVASLRMNPF